MFPLMFPPVGSVEEASYATNTRRAYASALRDFTAFCEGHGLDAFPATPQTIAEYVTHLAARAKVSTIRQRLAAISVQHERNGIDSPCTRKVVRDAINLTARQQTDQKKPITATDLFAMLHTIGPGDGPAEWRDRAILLLGLCLGARRGELARLDVRDIQIEEAAVVIQLSNRIVTIPYKADESLCAARAVKRYVAAAGIESGPLFRALSPRRKLGQTALDGRDVANLVKRLARRARLDGNFSSSSLRSGFVIIHIKNCTPLSAIADSLGTKSFRVYGGGSFTKWL